MGGYYTQRRKRNMQKRRKLFNFGFKSLFSIFQGKKTILNFSSVYERVKFRSM